VLAAVVIELDAPDVAEPLELVAVTVNVYEVEAVKPVTVIGEAPEPEPAAGDDVTLYVLLKPPVPFAVYVSVADDVPAAVAVPMVGACGIVVAVMLLDAADAPLVPTALVAVTVKV
jgi:hypothetical protein